jgi:predicted lipid-binding transport protein (Tim44 family)
LAITFVDDFVAGPILAATAALVGGQGGLILGVVMFPALVTLLVSSALLASRDLSTDVQARIDEAVDSAAGLSSCVRTRRGDRHRPAPGRRPPQPARRPGLQGVAGNEQDPRASTQPP